MSSMKIDHVIGRPEHICSVLLYRVATERSKTNRKVRRSAIVLNTLYKNCMLLFRCARRPSACTSTIAFGTLNNSSHTMNDLHIRNDMPSHHSTTTLCRLFPFPSLHLLRLTYQLCYETIVSLRVLLQRFSRLQKMCQEC